MKKGSNNHNRIKSNSKNSITIGQDKGRKAFFLKSLLNSYDYYRFLLLV